jgi:uncharacterized protein
MVSEAKNLSSIGPTLPSERILSLDVLRGFALFGVLVVNIQGFAMILAAQINPTSFGDLTGLNYWVAMLTYTLANQKFYTLFTLLFGAGILLMTGNIENRGTKSTGKHYLRMMWLILFGLLHAYVLWYGDILVAYGCCGLLVFLFRKMSAKKLLIIGFIGICIPSLITVVGDWSFSYWPEEFLKQFSQMFQPGKEAIAQEIAIYQGGWWGQMAHRVPLVLGLQTFDLPIMGLWRISGLMLIGMALLQWKILTAQAPKKLYWNFLVIGTGIGLALVFAGWFSNFQHNWDFKYSMFRGQHFNYWGSLFLSAAYLGGIMLICQSGKLSFITRPLAAVGRMAFTNYIMQTIICIFLFYGYGFGLFGKVERIWQFLIVVVIYAFQLWISQLWLKHFRFGPLEWLWRSLTYRKMQPMRR